MLKPDYGVLFWLWCVVHVFDFSEVLRKEGVCAPNALAGDRPMFFSFLLPESEKCTKRDDSRLL